MDQQKKPDLFKSLLNEYAPKQYITKSNLLYPPSRNRQDGQEEEGKQDWDAKLLDMQQNTNDKQQSYDAQPQDYQKFELLQNLSPKEFLQIKNEFSINCDHDKNLDMIQFNCMLFNVIFQQPDYKPEQEGAIQAFVEIFNLIDVKQKEKIGFQQFTNFLIEMQDIINRDESLFEIKLMEKEQEKSLEINPAERLFPFVGFKQFGILENNLKYLRLVNPANMQEVEAINIGASTITTAYFLEQKDCIIICSNDKNVNFYEVEQKKLIRRFTVPEVQIYIDYSPEKNALYTANSSGTISSWDVDKIFDKSFQQNMYQRDSYKLVYRDKPLQEQLDLTYLLNIDDLQILATGSNDTMIRLYENKRKLRGENKILNGHLKGIKCLSYCSYLKYLISCAFDFNVLVWNISLDHPVAKLSGHDAPLICVICPSDLKSYLISGDSKGTIKLWDLTSFGLIQNLVAGEGVGRMKAVIHRQSDNKLVLSSKKLNYYEFDKSFNPNLSDDKQILSCQFSNRLMELYSAAGRSVKCWDAIRGVVVRYYKNISELDLTAMALDHNQRKLFLGCHSGDILCIDALTGFKIRLYNDKEAKKEIAFIRYSVKYNIFITGCWDKQIRIYNDIDAEREEKAGITDSILRTIKNTHKNDIVGGDYSETFNLIATIGRDQEIRIWDFELAHYKYSIQFPVQNTEFIFVKFIDPLPLIIASDIMGFIYIWSTQTDQYDNELLVKWKNMFTIEKAAQVTYINYIYWAADNLLHLILGDETGYIRILNLSSMLEKLEINPSNNKEQNKNMYRRENYSHDDELNDNHDISVFKEDKKPKLQEKQAKQVLQWKAHSDIIKQIVVIQETEGLNYLTIGADKLIKLWNENGQLVGKLQQGQTINKKWNFILKQDHKHFIQEKVKLVKNSINHTLVQRRELMKQQNIPFQQESEDNEIKSLSRVESQAIYKELQEVDKYLDKNIQSNKQYYEQKQKK